MLYTYDAAATDLPMLDADALGSGAPTVSDMRDIRTAADGHRGFVA